MASSSPSSPNESSPSSARTSMSQATTSAVFVINALDKIANTKEGRKNKELKEAVHKTQTLLKTNEPAPEGQTRSTLILMALQTAIDTRSANLMTIALDCLGKFITYNYLADIEDEIAQAQVMERVVDSICDCFIGEDTDEKVQLQIIKALLDAVYSTSNPVHQTALLKAVRTTYNIFLLSRNNANQNIAQVTLTQMVDHIFRRIRVQSLPNTGSTTPLETSTANGSSAEQPNTSPSEQQVENASSSEAPATSEDTSFQDQIVVEANMARSEMGQKLPSGKVEKSAEFLNDTDSMFLKDAVVEQEPRATETEHAAPSTQPEESVNEQTRSSLDNEITQAHAFGTESDLFIKDAILVFRALCKLSKKPISSEWGNDMRSYSMRSKLLSLHLILTILTSHMDVFTSPAVTFSVPIGSTSNVQRTNPFIQEVKQYLCPSLGRNAFSVVQQVFDITLEILWKVIHGLRMFLKKEIEVFLREIFLRILEMRTASYQQKHSLLKVMLRICNDPQMLVDIYLNYDCDREALDNIYERLVNVLSKITTSHTAPHHGKDQESFAAVTSPKTHEHGLHANSVVIPPPLTTETVQTSDKQNNNNNSTPIHESALKFRSLECLVSVLQSLVNWYTNGSVSVSANGQKEDDSNGNTPRDSEDLNYRHGHSTDKLSTSHSNGSASRLSPTLNDGSSNAAATPPLDDPEQFENRKHRKQLLQEGIRQFNWKPKKGIQFLAKHGFIDIKDNQSVAKFLLTTEGLSKAQIGEFLGEGDPENIAIMHAFVDELDFNQMKFLDALRALLQTFRLPGEGQKIDRFMLKFGERYMHFNPGLFSNAETVYVLAYSTIMLNVDLHSPRVKNHMTLNQFISNNRGIDDGKDIDREILESIYEEISKNEIKLEDEVETENEATLFANQSSSGPLNMMGIQNALVSAGLTRDVRREALQAATEKMGSKTEAMFRNMLASRRRAGESELITFYSASHVEHIRPMFEVAWMAFLSGISGPLQESNDLETVRLCLDGFKNAVRIICLFHTVQSEDVDLQRDAFITTLTKFTFLSNLNEMKPKNVEAIRTLLEIAAVDGNHLKGSWKEVLSTVSQLERFQNSSRTANQLAMVDEVASAGSSQSLLVAADKLFTNTVNLNGNAIVDFVRALCDASWEEIVSSARLEHPRMYSLQKLVEISYYNMNRIRIEWSNIWAILGEYFNKVACQSNFNVAFFALDSLRQLSMQFLEKEELPHFKFQKDFLMPFRQALANNPDLAIKDMVLRCLSQMVLARGHHIRSGWKTMLSVFATAARETSESIVHMAFDIVRSAANERFLDIVVNGTFPDYISCLVEFSKNKEFQKISLPALDMIKETIPRMLEIAEKNKTLEINDVHAPSTNGNAVQTVQSGDDFLVKFWFAVLFGYKEVTMHSHDVEVRKRSLKYLFDTLKEYGSTYPPEFWTTVSRQIVFPLFDDLKLETDHRRGMTSDDLSVWMSTTMIEALRNVVDLYSFYFESMRDTMRQVLDLFGLCITQEDDTLASIGRECLEQYVHNNVEKYDNACWDLVIETFVNLFEKTTAYGLFDDTRDLVEQVRALSPTERGRNGTLVEMTHPDGNPEAVEARQSSFQKMIVQCVLQRMLIQTVSELLSKDAVYFAIPAGHLMELMGCLERSFHFAKRFNQDYDLRVALWQFGFMTHLPNLLKQETSSGGCYVTVLMRMYANLENIADRDDKREEIEAKLLPLCNEIFTLYTELDHETKRKNIAAWTPVVISILNGLSQFQDEDFLKHVPKFYSPAVELLGQENLLPEIRLALRTLLVRVGKAYHISTPPNPPAANQ